MAASHVTVENGSTYSDYDVATDSRTWNGGTRNVPVGVIVDGTANTSLAVIAEDAAPAGAEGGLVLLAKRTDSPATSVGTDGDMAFVNQDSEGSLYVNPRRKIVMVESDISGLTTVTTTYTAGDQLGTEFSISGCARLNAGSGTILGAVISDDSDVIGAMDVFIFDTTVTDAGDNAANSFADADGDNLIGVLQFAGAFDSALNRMLTNPAGLPLTFKCESASTTLYFVAVTRTANAVFAGGSTSLHLRLFIQQD